MKHAVLVLAHAALHNSVVQSGQSPGVPGTQNGAAVGAGVGGGKGLMQLQVLGVVVPCSTKQALVGFGAHAASHVPWLQFGH